MPTLGGIQMIRNGIKFDYPFVESITNMCLNCDKVVVVGIETDDGTIEELERLSTLYSNLRIIVLPNSEWEAVREIGSERLSYFQNIAILKLDTDYIYYQQSDELATDESWPYIREAMERGIDGYIVTRRNLWQSCDLMLNVPQERKPCSTHVLRLFKKGNFTYGDGESATATEVSFEYENKIFIIHFGFVRKKEVHPEKIRQMQRDIFLTTPDAKLKDMTDFIPQMWFGDEDLVPLTENHPKIMETWIQTRP